MGRRKSFRSILGGKMHRIAARIDLDRSRPPKLNFVDPDFREKHIKNPGFWESFREIRENVQEGSREVWEVSPVPLNPLNPAKMRPKKSKKNPYISPYFPLVWLN